MDRVTAAVKDNQLTIDELIRITRNWQHDCPECIFLGVFRGYDLYVHTHPGSSTVVARFGSEPHQYQSGTVLGKFYKDVMDNPIGEAFRRAVAASYIDEQGNIKGE